MSAGRPLVEIRPLSPLGRRLLAEFFGAFILVFSVAQVGSITDPKSNVGAPLCAGLTLALLVFALGPTSGAHFNPAVSFAVWMCGYLESFFVLCGYVSVQFTGGFLAALLSWFASGNDGKDYPVPRPQSEESAAIGRMFIVELIGTMLVANSVLQAACSNHKHNHYFGLVVGLSVFSGAAASGRISGGAFNPQVAFSLQVVGCFASKECSQVKYTALYILAELLGAALAFVVYCLLGNWAPGEGPECAIGGEENDIAAGSSNETRPLTAVAAADDKFVNRSYNSTQ